MRTKANQLRRLTICFSAICGFFVTNATGQLLPFTAEATQHSVAAQQEVFDPYPANQNPFRSDGSAVAIEESDYGQVIDPTALTIEDGAVQPAQFTEMLPSATDEASLGASVLSNTPTTSVSGPMTGMPNGVTTDGMVAGPELQSPIGQPIGEYVGEFDPVMSDDESALLFSSSSWFRRGHWYSQADYVMMLRSQVEDVVFGVESGPNFGTSTLHRPTLSMSGAPLTFEPGMRLTLGKMLGQDVNNRDHAVEVTFFGLLEHTGTGAVEADDPSRTNNRIYTLRDGGSDLLDLATQALATSFTPHSFPQGFSAVQRNTLQYRTRLNSMEINYKLMGRPSRDRVALQPSGTWIRHAASSQIRSGFLGLRGVTLKENITYTAGDGTNTTGIYKVGTNNDMFGVQLGGEIAEYYSNWAAGGRFKAAGLVNFADRKDSVTVFDNGFGNSVPARFHDANDEHLAVLLEAGLFTVYQFSPNFTGRIGYDFMYLTGIADAPNNANLSPSFSRFEVTNDAYYHGLTVGFEMLW